MKQTKVLSGIAIATLSTVSVAVNADEVKSLSLETTANQTNHITEVTQEQVDSAKAKSDRATSDVETQQNVVNTAQNQQNQAQQTLVNATKKLNATQKLAQESTQENKVKAQQTIDIAKQMLSQIEAKQKTAETEQVKAQEAVKAQQIVVAHDKQDVATKTTDVKQAQSSVDRAKDALTNTTVNSDLNKAQSNITTKTSDVKTATDALTKAQATDKTLTNQKAKAQQNLDNAKQNLSVKDAQLAQANATVNQNKFKTALEQSHYYNQRDGAWASVYGGHTFASTGCVPSALAMVYSDLSRKTVTPKEVADYLFNQTNEFNKNFGGTSGRGIVEATKAFGYVVTHLASQNAIKEALKAGHHVVAAVQNNKFSPWGPQYSHEIVLRGSSNGNTYVYDPYNRDNNGFYSVDRIWNEQSRDSIDTAGVGVPFFSIMTKDMANALTKQSQALASQQVAQRQLNDAQAKATGLNAVTMQTPIAQANLLKAQSDVAQAKDNLANKIAKLQREVAYLQELKTKAVDAQSQYQKVLSAYKSVLEAKEKLKLAEEKAQIEKVRQEAVAVVDETGKITSYITSKQKLQEAVKAQQIVVANDKKDVVTKTVDVEQISVVKSSVLPSTGDAKTGLIAVLGMLLSLSGFLGIRKNNKNNI
ncbi:LPXTG cell wall anchor domain-containing protein [Streptococcus agalactiae]|uniref:LPXTG cell wall anchor domain-containing protein n=1 Tax=Streptococcus agalactiae TaxID=1311 RepID=UPI002414EA4F|nr:LPXTG cell wall anchor domain-containing protein [Streptococcus agalactiae]